MSKSSLRKKREFSAGPDGRMKMTNALEKVQKEVDIMRQIWHINVVPLFGVLDDPNEDSLYLGWYIISYHIILCIMLTHVDDVCICIVMELEEKGQIMDWDSRAMRYRSKHYPVSLAGGIGEDQLRPLVLGIAHGLAARTILHHHHNHYHAY